MDRSLNGSGAPRADWSAAAAGDPDAVAAFIDAHWERMHRVAFLITKDRTAAEDLAQDSMLKAVRGLSGADLSRPLQPWLDRIAANSARDWIRSATVRHELTADPAVLDPAPDDADWSDPLLADALPDSLVESLLRLPLEQRSVVVLRHLLQMSTEEIAAVLDIKPATVRTRDYRALAALRESLSVQIGDSHE